MNDWYKNKQLPPVGADCEALFNGWKRAKIIGHGFEDGQASCIFQYEHGWAWSCAAENFRLISSDRDKAIDAAYAHSLNPKYPESVREFLGRIYDAGLLRLPE